jgi:hypothetical protein
MGSTGRLEEDVGGGPVARLKVEEPVKRLRKPCARHQQCLKGPRLCPESGRVDEQPVPTCLPPQDRTHVPFESVLGGGPAGRVVGGCGKGCATAICGEA